MDTKTYTVMELASRINVPRTTINEWLSRYASYMDFQVCGKRRLYTENTLAILKEISDLRNEGKTLNEITESLRQKHPLQIRPEEQVVDPEYENEMPQEGPAAEKKDEFALITKKQNDELGRMIGESFRDMASRLEELESLEKHSRKVTMMWALLTLLILLIGSAGTAVAFRIFSTLRKEKTVLIQKNEGTQKELETLQIKAVKLDSESKEYQKNVKKLEQELSEQKKLFDKTLQSVEKAGKSALEASEKSRKLEQEKQAALLKQKEAELALQKEKFAAERLKLLKELEEHKKK